MRALPTLALAATLVLLTGCDVLGIETGTATAARKEAEGKAVGSACRHALRAIEDCYTLNPKAAKASVYAGWLEMDQYMRDNKLEGIVPVVPRKVAKPAEAASDAESGDNAKAAASDAAEPRAKPGHATAKPARSATTH